MSPYEDAGTSMGSNVALRPIREQWLHDGYVIFRNLFNREQIERYRAVVAAARATVDDGKDEFGYGDRVGQLHQQEPSLLELAAEPTILSFLEWAMDDEPVVMGSLNFDRGTEQEAHIDAIFFWPEPCYAMAGVWIALEDVHPDAGPLFYIPGSHRWPFFHSEHVVAAYPEYAERRRLARDGQLTSEERANLVAELGMKWTEEFKKMELEFGGERRTIPIAAGDVVIWHSLLAHGGSPRWNRSLGRHSAVFHYLGKKTKLYTFDQFFLTDSMEIPNSESQPVELEKGGGICFIKFNQFTTYSNNREKTHMVTRQR